MSDELNQIQPLDESVIGDAPNVDACALYKEYDERRRAQFVDRASFEHEVALHQQAIRERDAAQAIYEHDREMLLDVFVDLGLPVLDGVTPEQVRDAIRELKAERDAARAACERLQDENGILRREVISVTKANEKCFAELESLKQRVWQAEHDLERCRVDNEQLRAELQRR